MAILTRIVGTMLWGGALAASKAVVGGPILWVLFLGQRPGSWVIVGGAMVLAGSLVAVRGPGSPSAPDPQGGAGR